MEIKKNFHPIYRFYKTKGIVFFKSYILGLRNNLNAYIIFSFHPRKVFFCTGGINLIYGAKV